MAGDGRRECRIQFAERQTDREAARWIGVEDRKPVTGAALMPILPDHTPSAQAGGVFLPMQDREQGAPVAPIKRVTLKDPKAKAG